ncbi:MAG: hypothetical protein NWE85_05345 [Candidatus Bathyarchaeota archaeon]|nr:hypothetical protein [Candidatus Bathyarchaeota archaeon]
MRAYVTYRDDPVPGKIVAFEVHGPVNRFENLSFTRTAVTNDDGIANVSFRITWPNGHREEEVFGVWNVVAVVDIAEVAVNDNLSFLVGWIIELIKVETVDADNVSRISFMRDEHVCFRLTVKNIAMTDKFATLILDVYDNLSVSLGQVVLVDEQIVPGVTVMFIEDLLIPEWASLGAGVVYANAFTTLPALGGVPWCPEVSTTFWIVKAIAHDVAVINVVPSVTEAFPCQTVNVSVVVRNEGDAGETFDVHAYYDSVLIGTHTVRDLAPQKDKNIVFMWSTGCLPPGNYTLSAEASVVPGEVDVEDNRFVDGVVRIKPWAPPPPAPVEYVLPKWLLAFLFLLAVLVGACFVLLIGLALWCTREKKREAQTAVLTPSVERREEHPFKTTKMCSVCGREFPGVYTFCPYCMSFHGKDYE